jgi:parallel beta-helix repeat protein
LGLKAEAFSADAGSMSKKIMLWLMAPAALIVVLIALPESNRQAILTAPQSGAMQLAALPSATNASTSSWPTQVMSVLDYLPRAPVTDGSADYTIPLQTAIDAAAGRTLVLPDFPLRVSKRPNQNYCVLIKKPITLVGTANSVIRETQGAVQILRCDSVSNARFENFTVQGKGGQGHGLAHGIFQVWGGSNVTIQGVTAIDSDADGLVLASVLGARIVDCRVVRASKSAFYLSQCTGAVIEGCIAEDGVGHRTPQGNLVGSGIQLSSNIDLVCVGNVVRNTIGIGISCDANENAGGPHGNVISGNTIDNVKNAENMDASCGIRLHNMSRDTDTQTLVAGNAIRGCGAFGMYVENHGRSTVTGNTISQSERSGLVIGTIQGLVVSNNTIQDSDVASWGNSAAIYLINRATGVIARGNTLRNDPLIAKACSCVFDQSVGGDNTFEPLVRWSAVVPVSGPARVGDLVWNNNPASGKPIGWVCVKTGNPATWSTFGRID